MNKNEKVRFVVLIRPLLCAVLVFYLTQGSFLILSESIIFIFCRLFHALCLPGKRNGVVSEQKKKKKKNEKGTIESDICSQSPANSIQRSTWPLTF